MWKWSRPLLIPILLGIAPVTAQEDDPEKRIRIQDPIRNWSARIFEKNDKDEFVLVGELFGEEARPLDENKSRFRIRQIREPEIPWIITGYQIKHDPTHHQQQNRQPEDPTPIQP